MNQIIEAIERNARRCEEATLVIGSVIRFTTASRSLYVLQKIGPGLFMAFGTRFREPQEVAILGAILAADSVRLGFIEVEANLALITTITKRRIITTRVKSFTVDLLPAKPGASGEVN